VGADNYRNSCVNTGAWDWTGSCRYYSKGRADKKRHVASKEESELRRCRSEHSCNIVTVRNAAYAGKESRNAFSLLVTLKRNKY